MAVVTFAESASASQIVDGMGRELMVVYEPNASINIARPGTERSDMLSAEARGDFATD